MADDNNEKQRSADYASTSLELSRANLQTNLVETGRVRQDVERTLARCIYRRLEKGKKKSEVLAVRDAFLPKPGKQTVGSIVGHSPEPALAFQQPITDILVDLGICQSKSEARCMLSAQGGLYYGPQFTSIHDMNIHSKLYSPNSPDATEDGVLLAEGGLLILRRGKWKTKVIRVISDQEYEALGEGNWTAAWRARRGDKTWLNATCWGW
ncbi:MAG: hypothetical protein M1813_001734 [Trichoglossum hirsutum]|nr:MAG: hypothetical protein M1813_001734 [Trichoglossum hirsutum]